MDVQTGLIYVAVVVISALVIGFVSVFAMKEKSYEEAIAEQRKLPDDLLLGKKDKSKEKKHKNKMGKKVKEKKEDKEEKEEKPEHVQFEETPQILPSEPSLQRENLHQISQSETAVNKSPKETPTKTKKNVKEKDSKKKDDHKEEKKETPANGPQINKENVKEVKDKPKESLKEQKEAKEQKEVVKETVVPLQSSLNKESKKIKKKKDNDIYLAQFGGDRDSVNFSCLDKLVQNAELSRSEIQFLIEKLLNKQQDSPQELAEWTESRADPTIKLKKQLADTEKSLSIEREKNDSMQKKLAGLRTELNSDKQRIRQLEEKANEVQHLRTHIQSILDSNVIEKQEANRRIEELDAKITEDAVVIQKLQENQGQLQTLQQELDALHKQSAIQLENENSLKIQLEEKHIELQQTCESSNRELEFLKAKVRQAESQLQDMHRRFEESTQTCSQMENKLSVTLHQEQELKDQLNYFQNELKSAQEEASKVASLNEQLSNLQAELAKQKAENSASSIEKTTTQLTELRSQLDKREQELQQALSEINNLTVEITKVRNDLKVNQVELTKIQEAYKLSQKELSECQQELRDTLKSLTQTRAEMNKLKQQEENKIVTARVEDVAELQKQIQQLREKNESLTSQLAIKERSAVDGRENGIEEKVQKNNIQIDESVNLLAQKEDQLKSLRSQVESLRSQINDERSISSRLQDDLEQQRSKNNDDARKLKTEEQDTAKALLQRIFPEIKVTEKSHDQWIKVFEEQVHKTLNKLKTDTKAEDMCSELEKTNKNLQAMVNHYKQIIDDTEGMLNKLQSHIESEEKRWQAQLRQKETEVTNLRVEIHSLQNKTTNNNNELLQKVAELESRLSEKESLKVGGIKSEAQLVRVESRVPDFSVVEKLQQENVRLSQQLQSEISKQAGLTSQVAELRTLAESTESSLTEEKRKNDLLQKEMTQLKSEVCGGSSSSDQSTLNGPPASDSLQSEGGSGKK